MCKVFETQSLLSIFVECLATRVVLFQSFAELLQDLQIFDLHGVGPMDLVHAPLVTYKKFMTMYKF